MKFINSEIEAAYYASPLPLDSCLSDNEDYSRCLRELINDHRALHKALSPEQYRIAERIFGNIGIQLDMECRFYFQSGWLAAKENNK